MKPTKQIIEEMEKEWRDYAFSHKVHFGRSADKNEIWGSFTKLIPTLLSAFAEEVIGSNEEIKDSDRDEDMYSMGRNDLRQDQRLKVKEIISSIGK